MVYLLIALTPQNCIRTDNVWLYAAIVLYWLITLTPRLFLTRARESE